MRLQKRLMEIDQEIAYLARCNDLSVSDLLENPEGKPYDLLSAVEKLLTEKLAIQKQVFEASGGNLNNVIIMAERF